MIIKRKTRCQNYQEEVNSYLRRCGDEFIEILAEYCEKDNGSIPYSIMARKVLEFAPKPRDVLVNDYEEQVKMFMRYCNAFKGAYKYTEDAIVFV